MLDYFHPHPLTAIESARAETHVKSRRGCIRTDLHTQYRCPVMEPKHANVTCLLPRGSYSLFHAKEISRSPLRNSVSVKKMIQKRDIHTRHVLLSYQHSMRWRNTPASAHEEFMYVGGESKLELRGQCVCGWEYWCGRRCSCFMFCCCFKLQVGCPPL